MSHSRFVDVRHPVEIVVVGTDYGYSGSIAAAGLYTRSPNGVIYKVTEHPGDFNEPRQNVRAFARSVYDRFAKKELGQENARQIESMYRPDSWNNRGDDHTLAAQLNDELELSKGAASRLDTKQNQAAVELTQGFGHDLGTIAANCTKTASDAQLHLETAVLPN